MYRLICGAAVAGALLAPSHADGQIWKRLRGGSDSAAKPVAPVTVSDKDLAAQMAAGHVVLNGVQFGEDGRLDDASSALMSRVADALKQAHGRYRIDAFADASADTTETRARSVMYAYLVQMVLLSSGVTNVAIPGAQMKGAAAAAAAAQSQAARGGVVQAGALTSAAGGLAGGMASGLAGGMAGSIAGAMGGGDSTHPGASAGDMAKSAAENIIPGAKLAKLGFSALRNRGAAQAHADSVASGLVAAKAGSVAGAIAGGDTSHTGTSSGDVAKAAAEDLIPGAKLAKLGFSALRNRGAAQARADSTAKLRVARIEIVKIG